MTPPFSKPESHDSMPADLRRCLRCFYDRLVSPALLFGLLVGLLVLAPGLLRESADAGLPALARSKIETRGMIIASLVFHPGGGRLIWSDCMKDRIGSWDVNSGSSMLENH